jgi:hypothetical protein
VLVYAGELDADPAPDTATAGAAPFPNGTVTVQPAVRIRRITGIR